MKMIPELEEILSELEQEFPSSAPMHPIGGGNPYWACDYCDTTGPEISIRGHDESCRWKRMRDRIQAVRDVFNKYGQQNDNTRRT